MNSKRPAVFISIKQHVFHTIAQSFCPLRQNLEVPPSCVTSRTKTSKRMWKLTSRFRPHINSNSWLIRHFSSGEATGLYGFDHLKTAKGFQRFVADAIERFDFYVTRDSVVMLFWLLKKSYFSQVWGVSELHIGNAFLSRYY